MKDFEKVAIKKYKKALPLIFIIETYNKFMTQFFAYLCSVFCKNLAEFSFLKELIEVGLLEFCNPRKLVIVHNRIYLSYLLNVYYIFNLKQDFGAKSKIGCSHRAPITFSIVFSLSKFIFT